MTLVQLFVTAFKKPADLYEGRKKSGGKVFLYLLILSLILALPVIRQVVHVFNLVQDDMQKIAKEMPEFKIENNQLTTEKEEDGFIYQTDYMVFSFDPQNKRTPEDIRKDLSGNVIGVGLLKNEVVFAIADENIIASQLQVNPMILTYDRFDSQQLNKSYFENLATSNRSTRYVSGVTFLVLLIPVLANFVFSLLIVTMISHFFTGARLMNLTFGESFKLVVFASTMPVFITAAIDFAFQSVSSNFVIILVSYVLYRQIIMQQRFKDHLKK